MSVSALVGAQYGSEGKGAIAKHIANDYHVHVRTGAPNAGHTFLHHATREEKRNKDYKGLRKWVMRSVPCGWVNEDAHLMIGPGGLIDTELLREEVKALDDAGWDVSRRLIVDPRCGIIDPVRHHQFEGGVGGRAHELIGSTGEGVGPARMARIARGTFTGKGMNPAWSKIDFVRDREDDLSDICRVKDTSKLLDLWIEDGARVLLEGTQGSGLSLVHGPWPYCTSADTNAGQLMVDAGVAPRDFRRTILVARTYPIRVAGNSGPLFGETSWEELGLEPETTTVTKKVRRVGQWDDNLLAQSLRLNRPCVLALTFADYWWPQIAGATSWEQVNMALGDTEAKAVMRRLREIEARHHVAIAYISTGPDSVIETGVK